MGLAEHQRNITICYLDSRLRCALTWHAGRGLCLYCLDLYLAALAAAALVRRALQLAGRKQEQRSAFARSGSSSFCSRTHQSPKSAGITPLFCSSVRTQEQPLRSAPPPMLANATEAWDVTNETGCERCKLLLRARDASAAELDATRAQVMAGHRSSLDATLVSELELICFLCVLQVTGLRVLCKETQSNLEKLLRDGKQLAHQSCTGDGPTTGTEKRIGPQELLGRKANASELPKVGWLYKKGQHCRHRFFVLERPAESEHGILKWYIDDDDKVTGEREESWVSCHGLRIDANAGIDSRGRHWFSITSLKHSAQIHLLLGSYSESECRAWISAIASLATPIGTPFGSPVHRSLGNLCPASPSMSERRSSKFRTAQEVSSLRTEEAWRFSGFIMPDANSSESDGIRKNSVPLTGEAQRGTPGGAHKSKWLARRLRSQAPGECTAKLMARLQRRMLELDAPTVSEVSHAEPQSFRNAGARGMLLALSRRTSPPSLRSQDPQTRQCGTTPATDHCESDGIRHSSQLMLARALSPTAVTSAPVALFKGNMSVGTCQLQQEACAGQGRLRVPAANARSSPSSSRDGIMRSVSGHPPDNVQAPRVARTSILLFSDSDDSEDEAARTASRSSTTGRRMGTYM
jgi:hypothetical protein